MIFEIIFITALIGLQIFVFYNVFRKISSFRTFFPNSFNEIQISRFIITKEVLNEPSELENYSRTEEDKFEVFIKGLADAGIQVVVGSGSMSEMAVHFFEKYKIMAIKIMSKWELKRIARAVGATPIVKLGTPSPDETGYADEVWFKEISSQ